MKVICSWCRSEGKQGYLGEREPLEDPSSTHGVCGRHQEEILESLPSRSFPELDLLIVVHPKESDLYEYLQRAFAGVRGVKVMMERRQGDRRREGRTLAEERRRERRRIRQGQAFSLGYTAVRFKRKSTAR
jgi:hypothetical protein